MSSQAVRRGGGWAVEREGRRLAEAGTPDHHSNRDEAPDTEGKQNDHGTTADH